MQQTARNCRPLPYAGFTLIELLIATALGLLIIGAAIASFAMNRQMYQTIDAISQLQENARFSLHLLSDDIRHAGFWGATAFRTPTVKPAIAASIKNDCAGPAGGTNVTNPVAVFSAADAAVAGCLMTPQVNPALPLDVLVVKRADTNVTAPSAVGNALYLLAKPTSLDLTDGASIDKTNPGGEIRAFLSNVYYICTTPDNASALCRMTLVNDTITSEILSEDVTALRILVGIDQDGDGFADGFIPPAAVADWTQAVAARVFLLLQTPGEAGYVNDKQYALGDTSVGPFNDHLRRLVVTATVTIEN